MTGTTAAATGLIDDLIAITCPVDRAVAVSRIADDFGNLPPAMARIRREALQEARDAGRRVIDIAQHAGISPRRIYQLTTTKRRGRQPGHGASAEANAEVQMATPQQPPTTSQEA